MSMISAQIDELRELATRYDELQAGAVKAVTMSSDMGSILREAADTIWQLRDDLQRAHKRLADAEHAESRAWDRVRKAEAEADKLREERDMYRDLVDHMVHPDIPNQLAAENAKLHSICAEVAGILFNLDVDYCGLCDRDSINHPCPVHTVKGGKCLIESELRELGVEVD